MRNEQILAIVAAVLLVATLVQAVQIGSLNAELSGQQGEWVALLAGGAAQSSSGGASASAPAPKATQSTSTYGGMVGGC